MHSTLLSSPVSYKYIPVGYVCSLALFIILKGNDLQYAISMYVQYLYVSKTDDVFFLLPRLENE
jgi:hypothetical protein